MMRSCIAVLAVAGLAWSQMWAQTHVVKKPETVVRAVAVYEWTGEEGKATASRIVPVSVYINGQLEDAGIYLARPVPFALDSGTIFDVQKAGEKRGTLELAYARHYVVNSGPLFDDGWLAYGAYKPTPQASPVTTKKSGPLPQVVASGGNRPHFSNASAPDKTDADPAKTPVDRSGAAGSGTTVSAQDDPSRPTLKRPATDADNRSNDKSESDSAKDDPDRPTLKKRLPPADEKAQQKADQKKKQTASVTGPGSSLNDDPDRPVLHRGAPTNRLDEDALPPLKGVPPDMHQAVAVSDARDREEHDFHRGWESDAERAEVTAKLQSLAREQLAHYDVPAAPASPAASTTAPAKAPSKATTRTTPRTAHRSAAPPAAPPVPLANESLQAYTLSYGGAATYCYSATSPGVGGVTRYVSVVAQREPLGELKVALANVTDTHHLDRTPWLRLVDAVDAEASNRASLLYELRAQNSRQFALYRVIGAKAEQTFLTAQPE